MINGSVTGSVWKQGGNQRNLGYSTYGEDGFDALIAKLSMDGRRLIYSTYVGGDGELAQALALDPLVMWTLPGKRFPRTFRRESAATHQRALQRWLYGEVDRIDRVGRPQVYLSVVGR